MDLNVKYVYCRMMYSSKDTLRDHKYIPHTTEQLNSLYDFTKQVRIATKDSLIRHIKRK